MLRASQIVAPSKDEEKQQDATKRSASEMDIQDHVSSAPPQGEGAASSNGAAAAELPSTALANQLHAQRGVELLTTLLQANKSEIDIEVDKLKEQRNDLKKKKKELARSLRNKEKQRSRLRQKAKLLNTDDLLQVYAMRVRKNAAAESASTRQEQRDRPPAKTARK